MNKRLHKNTNNDKRIKEEKRDQKRLKNLSAYDVLAATKLFDSEFYLSNYEEVAGSGLSAIEHYIKIGAKEGKNPSRYFDTVFYLNRYPDVMNEDINPLVHYVLYGQYEGRIKKDISCVEKPGLPDAEGQLRLINDSELFDANFYTEEYKDIEQTGYTAVEHYLAIGAAQGRFPSKSFDSGYYLRTYSDVKESGINPLVHYLLAGRYEGRRALPEKISLKDMESSISTLIMDHDGGGGTWYYLYNSILSGNYEGDGRKGCVIARYAHKSKTVSIDIITSIGILKDWAVFREKDFFEGALNVRFDSIIINSFVRWPIKESVDFITRYKQEYDEVLVQYKGHDYYCVCPSYTLLDYSNQYCGVRCDETECSECIELCDSSRISLSKDKMDRFSITEWRSVWNGFFSNIVDSFEAFSETSSKIFVKAYPSLEHKIKVKLHTIPLFECCNVAVIGELCEHKGKTVLKALCEYLDNLSIDNMMIYFYGKCGDEIQSDHYVNCGPYKRNELPELLKKHHINVVLIPSIWHETFCYTMGESLLMGYPTACFDMGGQAEQAKTNDLGIILYKKDPAYIYRTLLNITRDGSFIYDKSDADQNDENAVEKKVIIQDRSRQEFLNWMYSQRDDKSCFVEESKDCINRTDEMPNIYAMYLPQFHDFQENVKWFGRGFSEWTNTSQTLPQFLGHRQPQVPIDVGYYNLNHIDIMARQSELAKKYGISGFCFYYYWFSGSKLMENPLKELLEHKEINLPFFLFWANDDWTKLWGNGAYREVLYKSKMNASEADLFMKDLLPYFKDERYVKIDNKPMFIIYNLNITSNDEYNKFIDRIESIAKDNGFDGIYLMAPIDTYMLDKGLEVVQKEYRLNSLMEFYPVAGRMGWKQKQVDFVDPSCHSVIWDVNDYVDNKKYILNTEAKVMPGLFPSWDNSARRYNRGAWVLQSEPEEYKTWLSDLIDWVEANLEKKERFIFVNAWNEWAEGAHLEPDTYFGYAYLQKTKEALEERYCKNNHQ